MSPRRIQNYRPLDPNDVLSRASHRRIFAALADAGRLGLTVCELSSVVCVTCDRLKGKLGYELREFVARTSDDRVTLSSAGWRKWTDATRPDPQPIRFSEPAA